MLSSARMDNAPNIIDVHIGYEDFNLQTVFQEESVTVTTLLGNIGDF